MTFSSLGLSDLIVRALSEKGYKLPTPIQAQAIPTILAGRDVMAVAQTGTGKTAGFTLPLLQLLTHGRSAQSNTIRALVLTPTRELTAQVETNVNQYSKHLNLRSTVVYGGVKINPQMMKLRRGVDILVATPGRLLDLYQQNAIKFNRLEILVLDEADRMLDMGFINDINKILSLLPKRRQNLMFSATFPPEIRQLTKTLLNDPVEIDVSPRNTTVAAVKQTVYPVDKSNKSKLLASLIHENDWNQVLVFTRTKRGANRLVKQLESNKINTSAIHGDKTQSARTKALAEFKNAQVRVLVATDIAARGIDISELPHVINFDLPDLAENYVHRIGRTGRAGSVGEAISLVSADEVEALSSVENLIGKLLPRKLIDGFEPDHLVPETRLSKKKAKPPKSKKKKLKSLDLAKKGLGKSSPRKPKSKRSQSSIAQGKSDKKRNRKSK